MKGYRLLTGYRGHPEAYIEAIEDVLLRISRLVEEIPDLAPLTNHNTELATIAQ